MKINIISNIEILKVRIRKKENAFPPLLWALPAAPSLPYNPGHKGDLYNNINRSGLDNKNSKGSLDNNNNKNNNKSDMKWPQEGSRQ